MAQTKNPENDFICKTIFHLNTIKGFHWQTESYAEHQVLDLYHNKLTELIDKFVETLKEFKPTTDAGCIDTYIDRVDVIEHSVKENDDLLSIVDDFEQVTNEALFHLRLK